MLKRIGLILTAIMVLSILTTIPGGTEAKPAQAATWMVPGDFPTIQAAIDSELVNDGDKIMVGPGEWFGATVTKAVEIKGGDGVYITSGPLPWPGARPFEAGFFFNDAGDGATISHFEFADAIEFPVFSRNTDGVTVAHCVMNNAIQAVSNWQGNGWTITHNAICDLQTYSGGGIGILLGAYQGVVCNDNTVSHNTVSGTLNVWSGDCGGYGGSGIVLYADFRWGMPGAEEMTGNTVAFNHIDMSSSWPEMVGFNAMELTDSRGDGGLDPVIFGNTVEKNDMRGSANGLLLTPENLGDHNDISQNKF